MKNSKVLLFSFATVFSFSSMAQSLKDQALKMVPEGRVVQEKAKEVKIQTPIGTVVEVEFTTGGEFEEASGDNVEKDVFIPGNGILSLKDVLASVKKNGKTPTGEWSLESSFVKGWHYEFEGYENGKKMDYVVDAKSGNLTASRVDD